MMNTQELIELEERYGAHNYRPLDVVIQRGKHFSDDPLRSDQRRAGLLVVTFAPLLPGTLDRADSRLDEHQLKLLRRRRHHFGNQVVVLR